MTSLEHYSELKEKVESLTADLNKSQGRLEELTNQLTTKFKCSTLKQAKAKLAKLQKTNKANQEEFEERLAEFEEAYSDKFE